MALVSITVQVTDKYKDEFEKFLKSLAGPQSPVPGDRLFTLARSTKEQRDKNLAMQKANREILKKAKAQGITG